MKITDYAILFMTILEAFMTVYGFEDKMLFERMLYREEINRTVDNITMSALEKGYVADVHGDAEGKRHIIDEQIVVDTFLSQMSVMLYGIDNDLSRAGLWDNIAGMVIISNNRYIMCGSDMGAWTEFNSSTHESRVAEIEEVINTAIGIGGDRILFPANEGEYYSQTISDYAMIVVYRIDICSYGNGRCKACILSGAAIKE